jgi:hypothetical protein
VGSSGGLQQEEERRGRVQGSQRDGFLLGDLLFFLWSGGRRKVEVTTQSCFLLLLYCCQLSLVLYAFVIWLL